MKILFVEGDDYCALTFEQQFKGEKVIDVIENLKKYEEIFLEKNPEYEDAFSIYVKELNMDEEAFSTISSFFGNYDIMKDDNAYSENTIFV